MDNDRLWNQRSTIGSKRPSSTLALEDREVKKSRTQPRDNDAGDNIPDNEPPLPVYEDSYFQTQDLRYSHGNLLEYGSGSQLNNLTSGEIENVSFDSVEMGQQMPTSIYDPMPYIDEEQPIFPLGTAQVPDWAQSDLILATETCARNFLSQPLLIDSYFPPSVQLDISMGNTPIYDVPTLSRYFEESPSFIEINGLWDSQGSHFQGHATTPDVRSGIGASQANEPLSQDQAESLLTESVKDVYSDYDTCFGVVSHLYPKILSVF